MGIHVSSHHGAHSPVHSPFFRGADRYTTRALRENFLDKFLKHYFDALFISDGFDLFEFYDCSDVSKRCNEGCTMDVPDRGSLMCCFYHDIIDYI